MKSMPHLGSLLLITALALLSSLAQAANDKAFFWELQRGDSTVYLFGSIHQATPDFYPLRPEIDQAFKAAQVLAVEADNEADPVQGALLAQQLGMYPPGESLQDHLSDETYNKLHLTAKEQLPMLSAPMLDQMRPGLVMLTLGQLMAMKAGLDPRHGLDKHFIDRARQQGKQVVELEGVEALIKMVAGLGPAETVIGDTINQMGDFDRLLAELVATWKAGDEAEMVRVGLDEPLKDPAMQPTMKAMLFDRNIGMADKVEGFIEQGGRYFVVVGAAHLVGDKGVPALLTERGYTLRRR